MPYTVGADFGPGQLALVKQGALKQSLPVYIDHVYGGLVSDKPEVQKVIADQHEYNINRILSGKDPLRIADVRWDPNAYDDTMNEWMAQRCQQTGQLPSGAERLDYLKQTAADKRMEKSLAALNPQQGAQAGGSDNQDTQAPWYNPQAKAAIQANMKSLGFTPGFHPPQQNQGFHLADPAAIQQAISDNNPTAHPQPQAGPAAPQPNGGGGGGGGGAWEEPEPAKFSDYGFMAPFLNGMNRVRTESKSLFDALGLNTPEGQERLYNVYDPVTAFLGSTADTMTLGALRPLARGLDALADRAGYTGPLPKNSAMFDKIDQLRGQYPGAALAGDIAGSIMPGAALEHAAAGVLSKALPALASPLLRGAIAGSSAAAAQGAAMDITHGRNTAEVAQDIPLNAALGGLGDVGAAGKWAAKYFPKLDNALLSALDDAKAGQRGVAADVAGASGEGYTDGGEAELPGAQGLIGKDFEDYLTRNIGGNGSFSKGGRDFDGGIENRWWEAKSGQYWNMLENDPNHLAKFKSDMGHRLKIARENAATYELFSNTPIPKSVKDWLTKKGIPFTELFD